MQDLFYTTVLAALMGYTRPCKTLARAKPVNRVLSPPLLISLLLQLAVIIVFQVIYCCCYTPRSVLGAAVSLLLSVALWAELAVDSMLHLHRCSTLRCCQTYSLTASRAAAAARYCCS